MKNLERHQQFLGELGDLYELKNNLYGDNFHKTYLEYGNPVLCIRLEDKLGRAKSLLLGDQDDFPSYAAQKESVVDTLLDLANYAIMAAMELTSDDNSEIHDLSKEEYDEEDIDDNDDEDLEDDDNIYDEEELDFDNMNKESLKQYLKDNGVKFHSKASRDELVKLAKEV